MNIPTKFGSNIIDPVVSEKIKKGTDQQPKIKHGKVFRGPPNDLSH